MSGDESDSLLLEPIGKEQNLTTASLWNHRPRLFVIITALACAIVAIVIVVVLILLLVLPSSPNTELYEKVEVENIMSHLRQFQDIAAANGGSRSVVNGYAASGDYVQSELKSSAGSFCDSYRQEFIVPVYEELVAPTLAIHFPSNPSASYSLTRLWDFNHLRYGGNGTTDFAAAPFIVEDPCNTYTGFPVGAISIVSYDSGNCSLAQHALFAENAGASAVLIYQKSGLIGSRARESEWQLGDPLIQIPALTITSSLSKTLFAFLQSAPDVMINITTSTKVTLEETFNIFCDTVDGKRDSIIQIGAHLDSVAAGPGINDDGSGSAALLEIVSLLARRDVDVSHSMIRFSWWGAEEIGLLGSRYYVRDLVENSAEWNDLVLYLNFDMIGSPNFVPRIFDGSTAPSEAQAGSIKIQEIFESSFGDYLNQSYALGSMGGGSDYYPFILAGKPANGMATGAGSLKTMEERAIFGGLANAQYDTCYHRDCDTVLNIDKSVMEKIAQTLILVLEELLDNENLHEMFS